MKRRVFIVGCVCASLLCGSIAASVSWAGGREAPRQYQQQVPDQGHCQAQFEQVNPPPANGSQIQQQACPNKQQAIPVRQQGSYNPRPRVTRRPASPYQQTQVRIQVGIR